MKSKLIKLCIAVLAFSLVFIFLQAIFTPKYYGESTTMIDGYSRLPDNSLKVLVLGPSQMFCSVDSGRLTEVYGIDSYDYGGSSQLPQITEYYFTEALKTQTPELVLVEVCQIFNKSSDDDELMLAWNYAAMPASIDKFNSVYSYTGSIKTAVIYTWLPLLQFHSRWAELSSADINYFINDYDYSSRGFLARDRVRTVSPLFLSDDDGPKVIIPAVNEEACDNIHEICESKGIRLIFFKVPAPDWTRNESETVKLFMNRRGYDFIDLNEYYAEIGIDPESDFFDRNHMNMYGAEKTTDFLAELIKSYM